MIATVALFMRLFAVYNGLRLPDEYSTDHLYKPTINQSINRSINQSVTDRKTSIDTVDTAEDIAYLDDIYLGIELRRKMFFNSSKMEPHMTKQERLLFYQYLSRARHYEEFGSGGSTVVALARPNILKVHTVESDRRWIHYLRNRSDISSAIAQNRLKLVYADIGRTRAFGFPMDFQWRSPKDRKSRKKWPNYSGIAAESDDKFDLIFVDGRFRVACFLKALQRILPEDRNRTTLMIHDYTERPSYHIIENFATKVASSNRLYVFQKKERVDEGELAKTIAKFDNVVD
eukprot:gnl/TRDRNA2_/TRDRNA2_175609_c0_seq7.p1 gnl/TRDRNA2_/TRDRNA2_175609_c0~~gnl/TRDRNA2_/TRDRNA2_175609_c0_seq7.p1  ORF type:complete len:288 (+),score=18.92 gnl/TRDRNA2_/TRDRNA2_175609_c0_seq7:73-936(+)